MATKTMDNQPTPGQTFLTVKQVAARYAVGVNTVWRWVRERTFPAPVKISAGCTRWQLADLVDFEAKRKGGR